MRTTLRLGALGWAITSWILIAVSSALASCDGTPPLSEEPCIDSVANVWTIYIYMGVVALVGVAIWLGVRSVRKLRNL